LPLLTLLVLVAATVNSAAQVTDASKVALPKLTAQEVSKLAARAFEKRRSDANHYRAGKPEFRPEDAIWLVPYPQNAPPYITDGDMTVVVNDRTRKACVEQTMLPPFPCT
jgi:hypothetical protein